MIRKMELKNIIIKKKWKIQTKRKNQKNLNLILLKHMVFGMSKCKNNKKLKKKKGNRGKRKKNKKDYKKNRKNKKD